MSKTPYLIYAAAVAFLLDILIAPYTTTLHPNGEASVMVKIMFWIINASCVLVGIVCWRDKQKITGVIGVLLAFILSILYFLF